MENYGTRYRSLLYCPPVCVPKFCVAEPLVFLKWHSRYFSCIIMVAARIISRSGSSKSKNAFVQNWKQVRAKLEQDGCMHDILDSPLYQSDVNADPNLKPIEGENLVVITLVACSDGFAPFKWNPSYSMTPYAFMVPELPPWLRTKTRALWFAYVLPGPKVCLLIRRLRLCTSMTKLRSQSAHELIDWQRCCSSIICTFVKRVMSAW